MEHGILLSGADNIDFMIHGVFQYSFFGHEVWITTTHVCVLIVMLIIIGFAIAANRCMAKAREVPEGFQNVVELIVEKLDAMVDTPMGKAAPKFYNYIGTIFIFILVSNISGLLGLRPPTADYGVTLCRTAAPKAIFPDDAKWCKLQSGMANSGKCRTHSQRYGKSGTAAKEAASV